MDFITHAAELVQAARAEGIPPPSALRGKLTFDDAYKVQHKLFDWWLDAGERHAGWKIGANSATARKLYNITDPFRGFLLESGRFLSGHRFKIDNIPGSPVLECELCVRVAKRIQGPGVTRDDVLSSLAGITPTLEVAGIGREAGLDPALNIADDVAYWGYVLGTEITPYPQDLKLGAVKVRATRNGVVVFDVISRDVIDEQLESVAWLANHIADFGMCLEAGQVIITGSCTPPTTIVKGDVWTVEFEGLGQATASFG